MALPAREDGAAHHRHPTRHRRLRRRGVPDDHAQSAAVSGSVGDTDGVVGEFGYRLSAISYGYGYRLSAIGYRAIGYRLSAIGYRRIGYRLSAIVTTRQLSIRCQGVYAVRGTRYLWALGTRHSVLGTRVLRYSAYPIMNPTTLYTSPNALAPHYRRFRVAERLLLTGHSHQAWPDCGFEGQQAAWLDAARYVDDKWERAFAQAERVRRGLRPAARRPDGGIALGAQHPRAGGAASSRRCRSQTRPRLVTTDGEFHTIRRQLDRLAEEGIEVVRVAAGSRARRVAERLARRGRRPHGAGAGLRGVLRHRRGSSRGLPALARSLPAHGAAAAGGRLSRAQRGAVLDRGREDLGDAFVVGGGYKYCQLGEGNCFLRIPPDCDAPAGDHRLVQRVHRARGAAARAAGSPTAQGARSLRRRHLRSDEPLPRRPGVRLLRGSGLTPPCSAR